MKEHNPIVAFAASFCCVMLVAISIRLKHITDELIKLNKNLSIEANNDAPK